MGELQSQRAWDDVVVVTVSDFGRTITSNGAGTDHGWGGNHLIMGGKVNGGRFHGKFPDSLDSDGVANLGGRGRLVPTLGWESMWVGLSDWFGVPSSQLDTVLPNLKYFPDSMRLREEQLFKP